ncbi:MAG: XRE family transcriptional regulator [uncultured bacterium]|nr:MAG: XRE family transcriptional regulator [uncultured bacterium]KKP96254.1 MAG: DNA-binding helix-turn-helix protein [Candidatus Levybacteria bacterium GW2011_GWA2_36_13]KKQ58252.1 MAG: DNA-binding helix-turn-helix protein [Microgenomates group bacterium GW2011_GWC1_38_14]KKR17318.1 MAG: DNA-binding helix-turn-helix protein [Candidatus Levybacteria bacterium GW2011_GWA1_39_32]OGH09883.1 MAG: hypothetical protein A2152_00135 [Candidatus Levybacteria bacterium RBG_16_35_6]
MIRVGQKFREERLRKNLSLLEIADATKIREEFLDAIEKGEYQRLPSPSYAQGFVRSYAGFLEMDEKESLALFRREFDEDRAIQVLPKGLTPESEFLIKKRKLGRGAVLALIVFTLISLFLVFQYRAAIFNPPISISIPKEGEEINSPDVLIKGKTDPNATVFIGNEKILVNDNGTFEKKLVFFPGEISLEIKAVNRFGKTSSIVRKITVRP